MQTKSKHVFYTQFFSPKNCAVHEVMRKSKHRMQFSVSTATMVR